MKLLQICCNLSRSRVFPELFENLHALGVEQVVFVPEKHKSQMGKNVPDGVPTCYRRTVRRSDSLFFFRKAQRSVPVIQQELDLQNVTRIHAHTLFTDGSIAMELSRRTGIPFLVTLRYSDMEAIWKYEPHLHPLGRKILRAAGHVVFLSPVSREKVITGWFREEEQDSIRKKSHVIPNGIDPLWLDGQPRTLHTPIRVGFAGNLDDRKRPLDALHAVEKADVERACVLDACGDGPLRESLCAALRDQDVYRGRIQGADKMKAWYRGIDMLLVPSTAETFGMVYLEAMSQGVPVLYTAGQGFDGQFPDGQVGYAVPVSDPAQQAECILRIADRYAKMSQNCLDGVAAYAWPLIAEKWKQVYES